MSIHTLKRDADRRSANPFRLPKSWDGEALEPLVWTLGRGRDGVFESRAVPKTLLLMDTSAAMIKLMSEEARKASLSTATKKAFVKNTLVRVRLVKKRWWWWDEEWARLYLDAGSAGSLYQREHSWPWKWLYNSASFRQSLRPGRSYALRVAVYQRGVRFYKLSCADDPSRWYCGKLGRLLGYGGEAHFSEEVEIPFSTSPNFDARNGWEKFRDGINVGESFLTWLGRLCGAKS